MTTKRFIVTTTINAPTEAIKRFDSMSGWTLIVVGDKKTPERYTLDNGVYLSPEDQHALGFKTTAAVPWGCIQRRNIGYLFALREGADIIASIDDDNIPYQSWGKNIVVGNSTRVDTMMHAPLVADPLYCACDVDVWHRGFPVQLLGQRGLTQSFTHAYHDVDVGVQAGLWDGEPDVDAVCRIAKGPFDLRPMPAGGAQSFATATGTFSPFNTQNTMFTREIALCMGLPFSIGRMDDIWAGYMAQRVMFELGKSVVYTQSTVRQERNDHDLVRDLETEMLGYRNTINVLHALQSLSIERGSVIGMYTQVTDVMRKLVFLDVRFGEFIDAWLADVKEFEDA